MASGKYRGLSQANILLQVETPRDTTHAVILKLSQYDPFAKLLLYRVVPFDTKARERKKATCPF